MNTITRQEAIKEIEEHFGCVVDHILVPQVEQYRYGRQNDLVSVGMEHYMDADGLELGYISPISKVAFMFKDNRRVWADSFKANCLRLERKCYDDSVNYYYR